MLVMLAVTALAKTPGTKPSAAPAFFAPGTVLHYRVAAPNGERDFDVTLRQTEGDLVLDWKMSTGASGSRTVSAEDRFHATAQDNFFTDGESGPHKGTSSVFLSKRHIDDLAELGKITATIDGKDVTLKLKGESGTEIPVDDGVVPATVWTLKGGGVTVDVLGNVACPLIVHQQVGFEVTLVRVDTAPPAPPAAEPVPEPYEPMPDIY